MRMSYYVFISLCVGAVAVFLYMTYSSTDIDRYLTTNSSVWCRTKCVFSNICYNSSLSSFIFYLGNQSVIKGVLDYRDFQTIQLSSVNYHNKFEANMTISIVKNSEIKNIKFFKKGLLFSRFKPDNIMHVFHDDLIPLYFTLEEICLGDMAYCEQNYRLIMHDDYPIGPHFKLYKLFSFLEPILLSQLREKVVICFEELNFGLSNDSVFYQYGFSKPQGPVATKLTQNDLLRAVNFFRTKLDIKMNHDETIVLVSRRKSRKILNENHLKEMLGKVYNNKRFMVLDFLDNGTEIFLNELGRASVFVGMHGAEMIFSIFLKPNSTVVELFPFGIESNVVSFIKGLSKINGSYFKYIEWTNTFKNNSVFHPDANPLHGGILHLPENVQSEIRNVEKVPAVECCNNPLYLYFMYQDTWIHDSFEEHLIKEMKSMKPKSISSLEERWFFPSVVSNITCLYVNNSLYISWSSSFNMKNNLLYDITVQESYSNYAANIVTENKYLKLNVILEEPLKFHVWITAIYKKTKTKSKDLFFTCL